MTKGDVILKNTRFLCKKREIKIQELYNIVSKSTLLGLKGRDNIGLPIIYALSKYLEISIDQLIGELPLNINLRYAPLLLWKDIENNTKPNLQDGEFITTSCEAPDCFALKLKENINEKYNSNTIIIVEPTSSIKHLDEIIVSIDSTKPVIRKVYLDGTDIYLEIPELDIPRKPHNSDSLKIYGVIREIRISKDYNK